jgi:hypothetical protein
MKVAFLASVAAFALAGPASAELLTFDSLPGDGSLIPAGYGGLVWSNFDDLNATFGPPSGYINGLVSPPNVAFNGFGSPASFTSVETFELNSFYLTAAFNDGLNVTVTGLLNGVMINSTTLVVNTSGPTLETFNWAGINAVDFSSCCGVHHDDYLGSGTQFVIDNLSISTVPEPSTWATLLLGFAGLGFAGYRRARVSRSV